MTDTSQIPLIQPSDFRLPSLHSRVFLFFILNHLHQFHEMVNGTKMKSFGPARRFNFMIDQTPCSALGGFIGAPLAAIILENAIASGGKDFHAFGTAGWLGNEEAPIGKTFQPTYGLDETGMIKDYAGRNSLIHFADTAPDTRQIGTVSVNSFYRLTPSNLNRYREQKIELIEMEATPLHFIATQKGATYQTSFVVSDSINKENSWQNGSLSTEFKEGLNNGLKQLPLLK